MKRERCLSLASVLLLIAPARLLAQYDLPRDYQPTEIRAVSVGLSSIEFRPTSSTAADSSTITFHTLMPVADFRSGLMDVYFGYTRFTQSEQSQPAILVGLNVGTELPLLGKRSSALLFPVMIAADFTRADAAGASRNSFNVASVGLGMGLKYRMVTQSVDAWLSTVAVAHYSTEGFSVHTGFSGAILAEFLAYFPGIPIGEGMSFGYRFRYQTWSLPGDNLHYRMMFHGPSIGVAF